VQDRAIVSDRVNRITSTHTTRWFGSSLHSYDVSQYMVVRMGNGEGRIAEIEVEENNRIDNCLTDCLCIFFFPMYSTGIGLLPARPAWALAKE
jgi:hypothetical protein